MCKKHAKSFHDADRLERRAAKASLCRRHCFACCCWPLEACIFNLTTAKTGFSRRPSVDLLNEVESEYRANIDFIRVLDEIDADDLLRGGNVARLATVEAMMLNNSDFAPYHYPLFGTQANNGPASQAMQWMVLQDIRRPGWLPHVACGQRWGADG